MKVTKEQIKDAEKNGLDEKGLLAMEAGDRTAYKQALDRLAVSSPGNIWQCTTGYKIWFDDASESERSADYQKNESELADYDQTL